jgi:hypothetical protein
MLFPMIVLHLYAINSQLCVQCPIWLLSLVPRCDNSSIIQISYKISILSYTSDISSLMKFKFLGYTWNVKSSFIRIISSKKKRISFV